MGWSWNARITKGFNVARRDSPGSGAERQAAWLQRVVLQCGPARFAGIRSATIGQATDNCMS